MTLPVQASLDDVFVASPRFMGVITPSGNTVVERVTMAILQAYPGVTPLFSRTPVFGAADAFPTSYDTYGMLGAARLLAHAQPEVLLWNGSKGAKIGVAHDHTFATSVAEHTGIPCTTSIIGMERVMKERGLSRIAVVTPYDAYYQASLVTALAGAGYEVAGQCYAGMEDNLSFASFDRHRIAGMLRQAAACRPDAIVVLCTNFPAAPVVPAMEKELGIPIFDSTALGVWQALNVMGLDTRAAAAWGRLFAE
ncbi:MAG: aspartate/glutamate racemase family protein [Polaromonas sp.]|nr:aspartate/glutamate racemase family protein [Polaromonas sp.]